MQVEMSEAQARVRRAYERGRLWSSAWRAVLIGLLIALLGVVTSGLSSLAVVPLTVVMWLFAYWRGGALLRGAFYGLGGGLVTSVLPLSVLRPCCAVDAVNGADCCTMPGACLAAGAVVGVILSAAVPFGSASWWRTAVGIGLGMVSVAILKCATLFAGEAFGLVGGLLTGVAATMAARFILRPRSAV